MKDTAGCVLLFSRFCRDEGGMLGYRGYRRALH